MGDDGNAQAIWHDRSIHVVYTDSIKPIGEHEDTHLLTLSWGVSFGLLQEGLAEFTSGCMWNGENELAIVQRGYAKKIFPSISSILSHKGWISFSSENESAAYPFAGAYVQFLINTYGLSSFEKVYRKTNRENDLAMNLKIFEQEYKKVNILEEEFKKYIFTPKCRFEEK